MTRVSLLSLALPLALLGCGGAEGDTDRPPTHPVTGVVTYKGSPVEGASVTFNPEARDGRGAFGRTDADGTYELTTFETGDGAMTGKYIVTITKYETPPPVDMPSDQDEDYIPPDAPGAPEEKPPKNLLPNKYNAMHTSDLRAEVKEDDNTADFALTD